MKNFHPLASSTVSCNFCGVQFNDPDKLEIHKQLHTGGERQELCGVCGEKFTSKSAMISHMQKHTAQANHKPFSCGVCHKTFSQKSHLNRHIKSHGGEPDLVCLVCNKQCKNKVELVRHRSSHVACTICSSIFDTRVQLHQHMLKSHPVQNNDLLSPPAASLDLADTDDDFSRSPVDILSNHLDSSPCPSSVDSQLDLLDTGFSTGFLADSLTSAAEDMAMLEHQPTIRTKQNLSLDDISDSSFFDMNHHIDDDLINADIFASVK